MSFSVRKIDSSADVKVEACVGTSINIKSMKGIGGRRRSTSQGVSDAVKSISSKVGSLAEALVAKINKSSDSNKVEAEASANSIEQRDAKYKHWTDRDNSRQTASDKVVENE